MNRILFALSLALVAVAGLGTSAYATEEDNSSEGEGGKKYRKLSITVTGAPACLTAGSDCIVT